MVPSRLELVLIIITALNRVIRVRGHGPTALTATDGIVGKVIDGEGTHMMKLDPRNKVTRGF